MASVPSDDDASSRLQAVRAQVLELAETDSRFRAALREAVAEHHAREDEYFTASKACARRRRERAIDVLGRGLLTEPNAAAESDLREEVAWDGHCPPELAKRINRAFARGTLSKTLEKRAAAAALRSFQWHVEFQGHDLPEARSIEMVAQLEAELTANRLVRIRWVVFLPRTSEFAEPTFPCVPLDREELTSLDATAYRHAALYWLGALIDLGETRPIIPKPASTGNLFADTLALARWQSRFYGLGALHLHDSDLAPDPRRLPADIAEAMWRVMRREFLTPPPTTERAVTETGEESRGTASMASESPQRPQSALSPNGGWVNPDSDLFTVGRDCARQISARLADFQEAADWLGGQSDGKRQYEGAQQHFGPILHRLSAAMSELIEKCRGEPEHVIDGLSVREARRIMLYVALVGVPNFDGASLGLGWVWKSEGPAQHDGRSWMKLGLDERASLCSLARRCLAIDEDTHTDFGSRVPTEKERDLSELERVAEMAAAKALEATEARDVLPEERPKLSTPKPWAMEAWQAHQLRVPQAKIAEELTAKYGKKFGKITQARVCEQIGLAKAQYEASGLADVAERTLAHGDSVAPARTLDPALADRGERKDHRSAHLREKARDLARQEREGN